MYLSDINSLKKKQYILKSQTFVINIGLRIGIDLIQLADPVKARGCSTNTIVLNFVTNSD